MITSYLPFKSFISFYVTGSFRDKNKWSHWVPESRKAGHPDSQNCCRSSFSSRWEQRSREYGVLRKKENKWYASCLNTQCCEGSHVPHIAAVAVTKRYTRGASKQHVCSLAFWGRDIWHQGASRAMLLLHLGWSSSWPDLPPGGGSWPLVFLGLQLRHCFCLCRMTFSLSASKDTSHVGLGCPPNDLPLTWLYLQRPYFQIRLYHSSGGKDLSVSFGVIRVQPITSLCRPSKGLAKQKLEPNVVGLHIIFSYRNQDKHGSWEVQGSWCLSSDEENLYFDH